MKGGGLNGLMQVTGVEGDEIEFLVSLEKRPQNLRQQNGLVVLQQQPKLRRRLGL